MWECGKCGYEGEPIVKHYGKEKKVIKKICPKCKTGRLESADGKIELKTEELR